MNNANELIIKNVRKSVVNGVSVKLFEAWLFKNGAQYFHGYFKAPAHTANRDLIEFVL